MSWAKERPIYGRLPGLNGGYTNNEVADWLTTWPDQELIQARETAESIPTEYDPLLCDEIWLDYLSQLTGFRGKYWDVSWPVPTKRQLINASLDFLWARRGSTESLSFFLSSLGVLHIIRPKGSFILGESRLGDELGSVGFEFVVIAPNRYFGSPEEKIIRLGIELYTPCWCVSEIIYDDTYFSPLELLGIGDDIGLFAAPNSVIKVS